MNGIKEAAKRELEKLRAALNTLDRAAEMIKQSGRRIESAKVSAGRVRDIVSLDKARRLISAMETNQKELIKKEKRFRRLFGPLISLMKKITGANGLGIFPVVPVAAVAGLVAAVAAFFKFVVNETRNISIQGTALDKLAAGEISAESFNALVKKTKTGGIFGGLNKIISLVILAMVAPTIIKMVRGRRAH